MNESSSLCIDFPHWMRAFSKGIYHHLKSEKEINHSAIMFIFYFLNPECLHTT